LTPTEIRLVQASFDSIASSSTRFVRAFYARLFEIDPSLQPLFRCDLVAQGARFMHTLSLAVRGLADMADVAPLLHAMGRRHGGYGVRRYDFDTVGEALLDSLRQHLGEHFDAPTEAAWRVAYDTLAHEMRVGLAAGDMRQGELWLKG
jgi:hemoglobin-like flavoprotein